jgi:hypothetical protein
MNTFPPYEIAVYNRVAQRMIGSYFSNQVPAHGDQISFFGHRIEGDPFELWGHWRVDQVVWNVASEGSVNAMGLMRTHGTRGEAACLRAEVHCWPAEGPFFADTPKWAKAATEPGYHDEDDASASAGAA